MGWTLNIKKRKYCGVLFCVLFWHVLTLAEISVLESLREKFLMCGVYIKSFVLLFRCGILQLALFYTPLGHTLMW